jgi:tetratricopeptide (TPR) repeat protein
MNWDSFMNLIVLLVAILFSGLTYALDNTETRETHFEVKVTKSTGYEIGIKINEAVEYLKQGNREKAVKIANDVLNEFRTIFDPTKKQYTFQTDRDFQIFSNSNGTDFQRIDWSYREALHVKAFVYSAEKDFKEALKVITEIEEVAPVSAGSKIEKAYIQGQLGRFEQALKTYQEAKRLSDTYESQSSYKPASLRGMGFILIELNELDEAEEMFRKSLELEPYNRIAISELEYIENMRAKQ